LQDLVLTVYLDIGVTRLGRQMVGRRVIAVSHPNICTYVVQLTKMSPSHLSPKYLVTTLTYVVIVIGISDFHEFSDLFPL